MKKSRQSWWVVVFPCFSSRKGCSGNSCPSQGYLSLKTMLWLNSSRNSIFLCSGLTCLVLEMESPTTIPTLRGSSICQTNGQWSVAQSLPPWGQLTTPILQLRRWRLRESCSKLQRQDQTCLRRSNFLSKEIVQRVGSDVGRKPSHSFIVREYIWYFIPMMPGKIGRVRIFTLL